MSFDPVSYMMGKAAGGGGGGSSTIVSKTITENGTYNASSDNADGYDPVTVQVGPIDTRTLLASWDFTGNSPLVDSVSGKILENYNDAVGFSASGAYFTANRNVKEGMGENQLLSISLDSLLGSGASLYGCDIEVDTGMFMKYEVGDQYALRFIMVTSGIGFAYRQVSSISSCGWSFYNGGWSSNPDPNSAIAYSTVKLQVAADNNEHDAVYVNGFLLVESDLASIADPAQYIGLGRSPAGTTSSDTCIGGIYLRALRVYRRSA